MHKSVKKSVLQGLFLEKNMDDHLQRKGSYPALQLFVLGSISKLWQPQYFLRNDCEFLAHFSMLKFN